MKRPPDNPSRPSKLDLEATLPPSGDPDATVAPTGDPNATLAPASTGAAPTDARAPAGYVIEKELGRGGMGVVYLARDVRLNRRCALKMILSGVHSGDSEIERFRTEAQAIARLQHPGIVQVFEIGEHDGRPFMALEYCSGGSLDAVLARNPLAPRVAAKLVRTLAQAMQAAHEANVIHRDLKPANVLLASESSASGPRPAAGSEDSMSNSRPGTVSGDSVSVSRQGGISSAGEMNKRGQTSPPRLIPKITDFGLAKKLDEKGDTRTGAIMGTPSYMPPEQAAGKKDIGPAADIYALGAILYECLGDRPPFRAATPLDTILQVLSQETVPLRQLNPKVPADLETIAHKCLQKDPTRRYATAQDLADDLDRFLAGEPVRARPVGSLERGLRWVKRNPIVATLVTAVFLVLITGIVVATWLAWAAEAARSEADANASQAQQNLRLADDRATQEARAREKAQQETQRAEAEKTRADEQLKRANWETYLGKLVRSQSALADGNGLLAMRFLEECPWNLRGWEHDHLWSRFNPKQTYQGHGNVIQSVAFSPDGKLVLTGSADLTARLWDTATGKEIRNFKGHTGNVNSVAFHSDGKRIVTGSLDMTARVWDAETGRELHTLKGHAGGVNGVAISPDGSRIALGSADKTATVWDAETGRQLLTFKGPTDVVSSVAFSSDGKRLLVGSRDAVARLWDLQTEQTALTLRCHGPVLSVACSPDGHYLLTGSAPATTGQPGTGSNHGVAILWDARTGGQFRHFTGHLTGVTTVAFSPDGKRVLTGADLSVRVWDRTGGSAEPLLVFPGHSGVLTSAAFSPDGKHLLTGSRSAPTIGMSQPPVNEARLWELDQGSESLPLQYPVPIGPVYQVAFSPDGKHLYTGGFIARMWDVEPRKELFTFQGHQSIFSVGLRPDGKRLLTGAADGKVTIWNTASRSVLQTLDHGGTVNSVAYSPDGGRILTTGTNNLTKLWDAETGNLLHTLNVPPTVNACSVFSPDGKAVLTPHMAARSPNSPPGGTMLGGAKLWNAETGQEIRVFLGHVSGVRSVAFSPDGKRILTGGFDYSAKLWDADTGREIRTFQGHLGPIYQVAFSPDGKRILTGSPDGMAKVWDPQTGQEVLTLRGQLGQPVFSVAFSPDGKRVFTGGLNTGKLWNADRGQNVITLRGSRTPFLRVAYSPDGKRFVSTGLDFVGRIREADTGRDLVTLQGAAFGVAYSPDGKRLLTGNAQVGGPPGPPKIWDAETGAELLTFPVENSAQIGPPIDAAFTPDGKRVLLVHGNRSARVCDAETGREVLALAGRSEVTSCAVAPDGQTFALGRMDGTIRICHAVTGQVQRSLAGHTGPVLCVAFCKDGQLLISGGEDTLVNVWESGSGKKLHTLRGHSQPVTSLAVSRDGTRVAGAGYDRKVIFWETATGQMLNALEPPGSATTGPAPVRTGPPPSIAWSPDGSTLLVTMGDGTIKAWLIDRLPTRNAALVQAQDKPHREAARDLVAAGHPAQAYTRWQQEFTELERTERDPVQRRGKRREIVQEARKVLEDRLAGHPQETETVTILANLLLGDAEPTEWTVLEPISMKSAGGATLTLQNDRSILASGNSPIGDTYTVEVKNPLRGVTALRLEALPDPSLPKNGPGRHEGGNFHLTEISLAALNGAVQAQTIPLSRAGGYQRPDTSSLSGPHRAIDGNHTTVWDVWPRVGQETAVYFEPVAPIDADRLWVRLDFLDPAFKECTSLGRFRLAVTTQPNVVRSEQFRPLFAKAPPWIRLGSAYLLEDNWVAARAVFEQSVANDGPAADRFLLAYTRERQGDPLPSGEAAASILGVVRTPSRSPYLILELCREMLNRAIERDPQPSLYLARFYVLSQLGNRTLMLSDLARSLELDPTRPLGRTDASAHVWAAQFWMQAFRADRAAAHLLAANLLEPQLATTPFLGQAFPTGPNRWRHEEKELVQDLQAYSATWLRFGDPTWTDYDLELEAQRGAGTNGFAIGFRMLDDRNYAYAAFGSFENRAHGLAWFVDGAGTALPNRKNGSINSEQWYRVKVEVRGARARVFLDGEFVAETAELPHPQGMVGVRSWNAVNRYRAIKVTAPDGKILFEGLPRIHQPPGNEAWPAFR